ncbi:MAG: XisI protein [Bacteroidota bacterium]
MEKSKKYESAILAIFNEYIETYQSSQGTVCPELIVDEERKRYLLILIGWDEDRFVYAPLFHFDIREDKIWLQQNSTDLPIAQNLLEKNVPRTDIVLGFKPDYMRIHSGFGVA